MLEMFSQIKKNIFSKKSGLSLLELLIGISLLAIPMSMSLKKEKSDYKIINENIENISSFFQRTFANCIFSQELFEIRFYFSDDRFLKKIEGGPHEKKSEKNTSEKILLEIKDEIKINKLIINGKNELDSSKVLETWVYIYPEGYTQEIEVHFETKKDKIYKICKINPFTATLMIY